jgi:hypothetical protein
VQQRVTLWQDDDVVLANILICEDTDEDDDDCIKRVFLGLGNLT